MQDKPKALRHTIELLEVLFRTSSDGLLITDPEQHVIMANNNFCSYFGCEQKDMEASSLFFWLVELGTGVLEKWKELEKQVRSNGHCHDTIYPMKNRTYTAYYSIDASMLDQVAGEGSGFMISIWRDITENKVSPKKAGESVFDETPEPAAINRPSGMEAGDSTNPEDKSGQNSEPEGREVITSGLVHDFNNVLSIILGNSELALLDIDQSSPAHHHVKEINTACLRIEEILKRLRKQTR